MSDFSFKKADAFIEPDSRDLSSIFTKISLLQGLNKKILVLLEPNIAQYCQVANLVGNKLILIAANGAVATQVRFMTADLLNKLKQDPQLKYIQQIECKVGMTASALPARLTEKEKGNTFTLSASAAQVIREIAGEIKDDKLREVMEKIAGRANKEQE